MIWSYWTLDKALLLIYHTWEEFFIALACMGITLRVALVYRGNCRAFDPEERNRVLLAGAGFVILGGSSVFHAVIHAAELNSNLLYHTLLNYCVGLLALIFANSGETRWSGRPFIVLFLSLFILLFPGVYERFPHFGEFRPLLWISVAYLSGVVAILYAASYYRTRHPRTLWCTVGFTLVCISSIFLFFPSPIGSSAWLHGHFFRPVGFLLLLVGFDETVFLRQGGSVLNRIIAAFSLLAAMPLLIFGTIVSYENFAPIDIKDRQVLVFLLLLVTLCSVLVFGLGMVMRLILPILRLKSAVARYADEHVRQEVITTRDKDEISDLAATFNEMVEKLDRAREEKERLCRLAASGELAATVAHEIKNPLNAIGGAAAYIGKNYKGELIEEFVKVITDEVARINKLASSLLSFAAPITPVFETCDVNRLVSETLLLIGQEAREQEVLIERELEGELPAVQCDAGQIKQVLINLLINAFDAVGAQGRISVSTSRGNGHVALAVRDNGKGIPEENLKQIFNPFFTTNTRGTGLGLAISKKVALANNGDLLVESTPGQGSTFTLVFQGGN